MLSFLVGPGAPSSPGSGRERSSRAGRGETARPGGYSGGPAVVFTGDTLFRNSVGGVRAPGHTSYTDLRDSIMGTLMELPGETIIYPGHAARARSPRSGSPTASSAYGGGLTPRAQSPAPRWGSRRRSCCSQRTTTAAPRRGCAGPMAQTTSCPARGCSAAAERMARESEKIPTSRVRRTATVASLAATEAMKQFGTRAANVARSEQASDEAMARRQLETAKQIVAALGTMKGAAMKLGQVMSFLDVGLVPEEHREEFQRKLGALRDAAPKVRFSDMRKVIEEELDEPLNEIFASFDETPVAAASIGQVYRGTLKDGREVAVKVQYPGVATAVRADLQNLDMILRLLKRMTPGLDVKAIAEEIRERIVEELDYELEAQNQRALARIFEGHPFIVVPEVLTSMSRERVLVSAYVSGVGFEELKHRPQSARDRLGEIVFRFFLGCVYRHRQFSGDPHPGNFLLQEDGRVAFRDFA